jgi:hypothetical protein
VQRMNMQIFCMSESNAVVHIIEKRLKVMDVKLLALPVGCRYPCSRKIHFEKQPTELG